MDREFISKLHLGTAQFGASPYGITNNNIVSDDELNKILDFALKIGVKYLHTSPEYEGVNQRLLKYGRIKEFQFYDKLCTYDYYQSYFDEPFWYPIRSIVTIPANIYDRRFLKLNIPSDIFLIARSVFLQGKLIETHGLRSCLDFINKQERINAILVGVSSLKEFQEICSFKPIEEDIDYSQFACNDLDIIDPRRWNK